MRSDAKRHREMLVIAAARIFTRHGADAPLQSVLDEAQLGRGTLYRHFADREALIVAVIEYVFEEMARFVETRMAAPGAPDLLRDYLSGGAELQPSFTSLPDNVDAERVSEMVEPVRRRFRALQESVVEAAIASGEVGPDFTSADMDLMLKMLIAATSDSSPETREAMKFRVLAILFDGVRLARMS